MTPEMQAFYDAFTTYVNESFFVQMTDIISFLAGLATALAFATASKFRW